MGPEDRRGATSSAGASGSGQPDPGLLEMAAHLASEADSITERASKAEVLVRLALLCWDLFDDSEAAERYLRAAGSGHPETAPLLTSFLVSRSDKEGLKALLETAEFREGPAFRDALFHRSMAELWLFHFNDPKLAASSARSALRRDPEDQVSGQLATLALEALGDREALAKHLRTLAEADPAAAARLATLAERDTEKWEEAARVIRRRRAGSPQDPYLLERLWEMTLRKPPPKLPAEDSQASLLNAKISMLESLEQGAGECDAARYMLAEVWRQEGDGAAAAELMDGLMETESGWAVCNVLQSRRSLAVEQNRWDELSKVYQELADRTSAKSWAAAYRLRGAELLEMSEGVARAEAEAAYRQVLSDDPGNPVALSAVQRIYYRGGAFGELADLFEKLSRRTDQAHLVRWTAAIVEGQLEDPDRALTLGTGIPATGGDVGSLHAVARLHRRAGHRGRLRELYIKMAASVPPDRAALYTTAAGLLALSQGDLAEAERLLEKACQGNAADPVARMSLSEVYRRSSRWKELGGALEALKNMLASPVVKVHALRERGRVALDHLGDVELAEACFNEARQVSPTDASIFHELARIADRRKDYPVAVEMRKKAVELAGGSYRAAVLLVELGQIQERQLEDEEEAEKSFLAALELDDEQMDAIKALATMYRRQRRWPELLEAIRLQLELEPENALGLHLDAARLISRQDLDPEQAIIHFRSALELDPGNQRALDGLERLSRRSGRWDDLTEVLKSLPEYGGRLSTLIEGLERLKRWEELAGLLERATEAEKEAEEKSRLSRRLAGVCEERLGDPDRALKWYRRACEVNPKDPEVQRAYQQILGSRGRWGELCEVLKKELGIRVLPPERRIQVHIQLGMVLMERLEKLEEAAENLERAADLGSDDPEVLSTLGRIYESLGRGDDLLRVLDTQARSAAAEDEQLAVLLKAGHIQEDKGDADEALSTYLRGFRLDPGSREAFTSAERLCFKLKRWKDALELYEEAIDLVEAKGSRAYRLADLYARRGQLQLQHLVQPGEAAASYLRVLELDPENDTASKFLESIFAAEGDWAGLVAAYEHRAELLTDEKKQVETLRRAARVAAAKMDQPDEAARLYEEILLIRPDDGEAMDALERFFERSRQWEKLVAVLQRRMAQAEDFREEIPLYLRVGLIYEEGLRNVEEAVANYKKVLEHESENKEALESLARIYEATERWGEFIDITRRQIRNTKDRIGKALLYFKCGSVVEAKFGKTDDALRYYNAAIKTAPTCLPAVHGLRDIHIRRKEWTRVLETLELEVKLWQEPRERAGVLTQIGRIYARELGQLDKAQDYFESALAVDAECMPARRALFDMAFEQGDWDRAADMVEVLAQKAMREGEPAERSEFYRKCGLVAQHIGQTSAAADNLVVSLEIWPENLAALDALTSLCRRHPDVYDYESAFSELGKVYQRKAWPAAQARVLVARGTLLENLHKAEEAAASFRQAVELAPADLSVALPLVELNVKLLDFEKAHARLDEFVGRTDVSQEDKADALTRLATILSEGAGDSNAAEKVFQRVLRLKPKDRKALYGLCQELVVQGRLEEARDHCEELIEVATDPSDTAPPEDLGLYYYYLGRIEEIMGRDQKAGLNYRRAVDLNPVYPPPVIALSDRYAASGNLPHAEAVLVSSAETAASRNAPAAAFELRRSLAALQSEAGRRQRAVEEMRSIVAEGSELAEDRLALARLYAKEPKDLALAVTELEWVLDREPSNVQAIELLASVWQLLQRAEPRRRTLETLSLLGRGDEGEIEEMRQLALKRTTPTNPSVTDELVQLALFRDVTRGPYDHLYGAAREQLEEIYPAHEIGQNHVAYIAMDDEEARADLEWTLAAFSVQGKVDLYVGEKVPHRTVSLRKGDRLQVVLDQTLVSAGPVVRKFSLARSLAYERLGYMLLGRLGPKERNEVGHLLQAIGQPEDKRDRVAKEFLQRLPRRQFKAAERVASAAWEVIVETRPRRWMSRVDQVAARLALALVDELDGALSAMAFLQEEDQVLESEQSLARLYSVEGAWDLLRYYLTTNYQNLVEGLETRGTESGQG